MKRIISKQMKQLIVFLFIALTAFTVQAANPSTLKSGDFSYALTGKYPPFNFVNDRGNLDGFDVEIGKEIAKRLKLSKTDYNRLGWDYCGPFS